MFKTLIPPATDYSKCIRTITNQTLNDLLPNQLINYVIAIEDRRFLVHRGFDLYSIARVFIYRLCGVKIGGASTIGQQLARTITNDREKCIARKIREIKISCYIESNFSKKVIIQSYLNIAYFGVGLIGACEFSENFFNKKISDLNNQELAIVATCLRYPYPGKTSKEWLGKVKRRANYAQVRANQKNWIK